MDKILINIVCESLNELKKLKSKGVELLHNSFRNKNGKIHLRAIVDESLISDIKSVVEVEVVGAMKDIDKEKQALVNKGNRYHKK